MKKAFIIAEAGVNHNGSIELAKKLVDIAQAAGCDAVKFQTFKSENVVSKIAQKAHHEGLTLRQAAIESGISSEDFDLWVNPLNMV